MVAVLIQTGTIETASTAVTLKQGETFGVRHALEASPESRAYKSCCSATIVTINITYEKHNVFRSSR